MDTSTCQKGKKLAIERNTQKMQQKPNTHDSNMLQCMQESFNRCQLSLSNMHCVPPKTSNRIRIRFCS